MSNDATEVRDATEENKAAAPAVPEATDRADTVNVADDTVTASAKDANTANIIRATRKRRANRMYNKPRKLRDASPRNRVKLPERKNMSNLRQNRRRKIRPSTTKVPTSTNMKKTKKTERLAANPGTKRKSAQSTGSNACPCLANHYVP